MIMATRDDHEAYCRKGPFFAAFAEFCLKEGYARIAEDKEEKK